MKLNFSLKNGFSCKTGEFEVKDLEVTGNSISYSEVTFYRDGVRYNRDIQTWAGQYLHDEEVFVQVANAYLRGDSSGYEPFGEEWEKVLAPLAARKTDTLLPVINVFDEIVMYELELKVPCSSFYRHEDEYLLVNCEGKVLTDIDAFYINALEDSVGQIADGELECLYVKDDIKTYAAETMSLQL